MRINYRTKIEQRNFDNKVFVFEVIYDLDQAIEQLCAILGENPDPFAENLCPYYGLIWPSAEALTLYIIEHQDKIADKKILEIGAGLAMPSFVISHLGGDVLVSDFHEDVKVFFERNLRHNSMKIPFVTFDWCSEDHSLGQFDLILGSDVLYESQHPRTIAKAFDRLLKPSGEVWLADPGRGYLQNFVDEMEKLGMTYKLESKKIGKDEIFLFNWKKS